MYPTIFHYIHTYGLMLAIAFLVGIWWVSREGKKQNLEPDKVMDLGLWVLVAAVVGSRIAYVLPHWNEFQARPWTVIAVWEGGLTFYGGVLLAVPVGFFYMWRNHLPIWRTADLVAPAFAIGIFFGRIGCLLNGCCFGLPTKLPWGITYPVDCPGGLSVRRGQAPAQPDLRVPGRTCDLRAPAFGQTKEAARGDPVLRLCPGLQRLALHLGLLEVLRPAVHDGLGPPRDLPEPDHEPGFGRVVHHIPCRALEQKGSWEQGVGGRNKTKALAVTR